MEAIRSADAASNRADEEVGAADWSDPKDVERQIKRLIVDTASMSVLQTPTMIGVTASASLLGLIQRDIRRIRRAAEVLVVLVVLVLLATCAPNR